ncbi:MAG TPA: ABC transporter permease [Cyclobacteriaceae bacterium]|nr:ABC transporter permease [Cyclobacteriaceae bacterium]
MKSSNTRPPRFILRFFRWYCHPKMQDYIEGDLMEVYERRLRKSGKRNADLRFTIDVLLLFRPGIIKPAEGYKHVNTYDMYKSYFKIAWRNLWKHKSLSFINIFGLATGMACSLLIFLFVAHELSYDRFNKDADHVHRVVKDFVNSDGSHVPDATTPPALSPAMQREIPGIEHVTRVFPGWGNSYLVSYKDKHIYTEKLFRADSSFFDVFTFPFVEGNAKDAFKQLNSVVLTGSAAKKYFGSEDPMGKVLQMDISGNTMDMMVSGVVKDIPDNAHFHFEFLIPIRSTFRGDIDNNWRMSIFYTYIKLQPHISITGAERQIQALCKRNDPNDNSEYYTQALTSIHLDSNLKWEIEPNGDRLYVVVFAVVGLLIVLIAAINYINLVTARSSLRAKEVGVRKVSGAYNSSLIKQFLSESVVTCFVASVVALVIAQLLLPFVNNITAKQLVLFSTGNFFVYYFAGAALLIGLLAGLLPALYIASFKPVIILKGTKVSEKGVFNLRKALVVVQFTISIALIASSLIIYRQINYMQSENPGLNKDQVLIIQNYGSLQNAQKVSFENELLQVHDVKIAAGSTGIIGGLSGTRRLNVKDSDDGAVTSLLFVGYDYLKVLGIQLKEGRDFSPDFPADTMSFASKGTLEQDLGSIILNETAVKDLTIPSPIIGQRLLWRTNGDTSYYVKVVGVTEDFHFASFKNEIKPFAFAVSPQRAGNLTVKLSTRDLFATLQQIENKWKQFAPDRPFQYSFLDETFEQLYKKETSFQKILIVLVILSIVIACLGLYGLTAFTVRQRIKEIGIRKVLGASVSSIAGLLSKDFLQLVVIAFLLASPLAWYFMNKWLQDYTYRIAIAWWMFALPGLGTVVIALLTVCSQAIRAAIANPVNSLRSE